jgi:hypothetical protein
MYWPLAKRVEAQPIWLDAAVLRVGAVRGRSESLKSSQTEVEIV